ncbi:MAG: hypothetical protein KJN93_05720, partial [Alphaproteobacteria bacterium]|nr:hypothetical protein [Alphaproteobacteria bacterium]
MLQSVKIGTTTETAFVTRWGNPTQKVRSGAQTEFIYRNIIDPGSASPIQYGRSDAFVIVTFQYGTAVAVRSTETEYCRATFPPRPPGHGFNTPATVRPVGNYPDPAGTVATGNYGIAPGAPLPYHVHKRLEASGRPGPGAGGSPSAAAEAGANGSYQQGPDGALILGPDDRPILLDPGGQPVVRADAYDGSGKDGK